MAPFTILDAKDGVVSDFLSLSTMLFPNFSADLNGTTGDMVDFQSTGDVGNSASITEMGNLVPEPSYVEAEEARLWSVATMNCLEFDAWTTVVEEMDKNAEVIFG
ncbi:uncharacterized protein [Zea mays]|uniref:uncharacterized protein n=1 Tax=Zea mays TaxID=4577 RepID=UPI0009A9DC78|nr:uncharacterized protein LOC103626951 [Zea mays]|eukprot:XP_020394061.1 uncharacterized protein LOC103626951 [Zea mays]